MMSRRHIENSRKHMGDSELIHQNETKGSDKDLPFLLKDTALYSTSKMKTASMPSSLLSKPESELAEANMGMTFDLADPDDLLRKFESMNLTEEETDELLKRAYQVNKQLKQVEEMDPIITRTAGGSAPPKHSQSMTMGSRLSSDRPRSRGVIEGNLLPQLPNGRHQTSLSSGAYGRTDSTSSVPSQHSAARYTYHSSKVLSLM